MRKELTDKKLAKLEDKLLTKIEDGKLGYVDKLLADEDIRIRKMTLRVISEKRMQQYLSTLIAMIQQQGNDEMRIAAAEALGNMGWEPAFSQLLPIFESEPDGDVKEAVRLAMRQLHSIKQ